MERFRPHRDAGGRDGFPYLGCVGGNEACRPRYCLRELAGSLAEQDEIRPQAAALRGCGTHFPNLRQVSCRRSRRLWLELHFIERRRPQVVFIDGGLCGKPDAVFHPLAYVAGRGALSDRVVSRCQKLPCNGKRSG